MLFNYHNCRCLDCHWMKEMVRMECDKVSFRIFNEVDENVWYNILFLPQFFSLFLSMHWRHALSIKSLKSFYQQYKVLTIILLDLIKRIQNKGVVIFHCPFLKKKIKLTSDSLTLIDKLFQNNWLSEAIWSNCAIISQSIF